MNVASRCHAPFSEKISWEPGAFQAIELTSLIAQHDYMKSDMVATNHPDTAEPKYKLQGQDNA